MLDPELEPTNSLLQPMKSHVAGLGHLRLDGPVGQAHGDLVVTKEEGGGLGVAQVVQDGALDVGETSGSEEGGILSLLYGGTDYGDSVRVAGERPIDESKGVGRETCPRDAREVMK